MKFKKCNPSFYILLIIKAIGLSLYIPGVLLRMVLINSVIGGVRQNAILSIVGLITLTFFSSGIEFIHHKAISIVNKKDSFLAISLFADYNFTQCLFSQESTATQNLSAKVNQLHSKMIETTEAYAEWVVFTASSLVTFYLLLSFPWYVVLVYLALIAIIFAANTISSKFSKTFWSDYIQTTRRANYFSDLLIKREYAYEKKAYNTYDAMDERFCESFNIAASKNRLRGLARFKIQAFVESLGISVTVLTLFYFSSPQAVALITLGSYAAITELLFFVFSKFSVCSEGVMTIKEYQDIKHDFVSHIMDPDNTPIKKALPPHDSTLALSLNEVSFKYYDNAEYVLSDISYSFQRGRHYGIVGLNGAGKTTLAKILLGLYEIKEGALYSGYDSATALFQDFQVYPITIRDYLLLGNDTSISDSELKKALSDVELEEMSEMLDDIISLSISTGSNYSKGQLQRLALARITLSNSDFILLDEPMSSLDPIAEKKLFDLCNKLLSGRTTIYISHRLGSVSEMDDILLIDNGRIAESGTHIELMRSKGLYYNLYETQRSSYE